MSLNLLFSNTHDLRGLICPRYEGLGMLLVKDVVVVQALFALPHSWFLLCSSGLPEVQVPHDHLQRHHSLSVYEVNDCFRSWGSVCQIRIISLYPFPHDVKIGVSRITDMNLQSSFEKILKTYRSLNCDLLRVQHFLLLLL